MKIEMGVKIKIVSEEDFHFHYKVRAKNVIDRIVNFFRKEAVYPNQVVEPLSKSGSSGSNPDTVTKKVARSKVSEHWADITHAGVVRDQDGYNTVIWEMVGDCIPQCTLCFRRSGECKCIVPQFSACWADIEKAKKKLS